MGEGVGTMRETFETVEKHEVIINDDILPRLKKMEETQEEFTKEVAAMRQSQTSLELTVMKDGQQTRDLLGRFVDHYFATDDKRLVMNEKFTLKRLSRTEKVILGFFAILGGYGGVLAGIVAIIQVIK